MEKETGIVCFCEVDHGSKNESIQPFLYQGDGRFIRLLDPSDNPFENRRLITWDMKCVEIVGEWKNENSLFVVSEINDALETNNIIQEEPEEIEHPDDESKPQEVMVNNTEPNLETNTNNIK